MDEPWLEDAVASKPNTWMPLYVGDYLRKTMRLTTEQHGAYFLLLMACWAEGGSLPADEEGLAATARLPLDRWQKVARVILPFFEIEGGVLTNSRLTEELGRAESITSTRAAAGRAGAEARWADGKNGKTDGKPMAKPMANPSQNDGPSQSQLQKDVVVVGGGPEDGSWPDDDTSKLAQRLAQLAGPGLGGMAQFAKLESSAYEIGRWRQAGCSWGQDVLPQVLAMTRRKRASPIQSWTYFTDAILQARADRERPLATPEGRPNAQHAGPDQRTAARHANFDRALSGGLAAAERIRRERGGG